MSSVGKNGKRNLLRGKNSNQRRRRRVTRAVQRSVRRVAKAKTSVNTKKVDGSWSWANIMKYISRGLEIGQDVLHYLPFLSSGAFAKGSAGVSANNGWIGMVKPSFMRASPPPDIVRDGEVYTITHRGQLSTLCKNCDGVSAVRGQCLFDIDISPLIESWLQRMSAFEKYAFCDIAVSYIPNVPTTVGAKILGFFQWDIDAPLNYGQGEETIKLAMAHQSAAMVDVWTSHTWMFSNAGERKDWWYVDPAGHEPRLTRQGKFSVIAATDMDDANLPTIFGDLVVSYRCRFMVPELGSTITGTMISLNNTVGTTTAAPLGTPPLLHYDVIDDSVDPHYDVADNTTVRYFINAAGNSQFQCPAGYWLVTWRIGGTGLSAFNEALHGGYKYLRDGSGVAREAHVGSATSYQGYMMFKSVGITADETVGVSFLMGGTSVNYGEIVLTYLNGAIPYIPASEQLRRLSIDFEQLKHSLTTSPCSVSIPTSTSTTSLSVRREHH
jgi:hypothetical protein